jgi:hypothetical protein
LEGGECVVVVEKKKKKKKKEAQRRGNPLELSKRETGCSKREASGYS